ncbi:MAG: 16S rRNA (uracil(1498)-N(3))-methyltransferase [Acidobacteriota bacterium]
MNLVLLDADELTTAGDAVLHGARARHIRTVHRAAVGDSLRVGLVGGQVGEGVVTALAADEVVLAVRLSGAPPAPLAIDLLLAMPRPKMLRRIVAAVASMGVKRLVLINSARVEKSYFDSPLITAAAIDEQLRLGLAQARDTILPQVMIERRFRPFVEDRARALWPPPHRCLVAHPEAAGDLRRVVPAPTDDPMVLAIGPEGGWVPFELALLEANGFQRLSAGPRVLRVDTAVPFLLGQLALMFTK